SQLTLGGCRLTWRRRLPRPDITALFSGKRPRQGFSLTGRSVVAYVQKQHKAGFFANMTTVLVLSLPRLVGVDAGPLQGQEYLL
ncbi:MAG: hypothetical protein ACLP5H_27100, partial [Desulfomonilaceae bacterium]